MSTITTIPEAGHLVKSFLSYSECSMRSNVGSNVADTDGGPKESCYRRLEHHSLSTIASEAESAMNGPGMFLWRICALCIIMNVK